MGHVYDVGANGTEFDAIAPTSDGGFVAAGSATDANHDLGGLVVKVDGAGNVQWQRLLGPTGSNQVYLHDIQQTSDGGYVLAGERHHGSATSTGAPLEPALVVRLDPSGNVSWLHAYDSVASGGGVTATVHAFSIVQTADGGYAVGGNWGTPTSQTPAGAAASAHAERLDPVPDGLQRRLVLPRQRDVHRTHRRRQLPAPDRRRRLRPRRRRRFGSRGRTATRSVAREGRRQRRARVAGAGLPGTRSGGAQPGLCLVRAHRRRPLAIGSTENYSNGRNELLGVQTDGNGAGGSLLAGHPGSPLAAIAPSLVGLTPNVAGICPPSSQ